MFAGNLRVAKITDATLEYFHKDHLGSTNAISREDGTIIDEGEYLPYGLDRSSNALLQTSSYKFTDQEQDVGTGLYNYDARMYDPVWGQFVMADTIVPDLFDPQSLNRYAYCLNNPLKYVDPTGHDPQAPPGSISTVQCHHTNRPGVFGGFTVRGSWPGLSSQASSQIAFGPEGDGTRMAIKFSFSLSFKSLGRSIGHGPEAGVFNSDVSDFFNSKSLNEDSPLFGASSYVNEDGEVIGMGFGGSSLGGSITEYDGDSINKSWTFDIFNTSTSFDADLCTPSHTNFDLGNISWSDDDIDWSGDGWGENGNDQGGGWDY